MAKNIKYQIKSLQNTPQLMEVCVSESNAMYIVHRLAVQQLHQQRQGNANCKTRSEVKGGGKKPWKQKGTGRARAGSIRSPLWRGGGVTFGPQTKIYKQKINKKEKHLAINNLLLNRKDFTIAVDSSFLELSEPKTKVFLQKIHTVGINQVTQLLIIMAKKNLNIYLATRNLKNIEIISANQLNLLSMIKAQYILIENEAIDIIKKTYNG